MQEFCRSNPPVVTGICDANKKIVIYQIVHKINMAALDHHSGLFLISVIL